jgi:exonuclease SbcD
MKILHTADWHLCNKLGRLDRTADLRARVEHVAQLCLDHQVEVLLVAGDLFCEHASLEAMTDSLDHIRKSFTEFFRFGGTILAITGNHDRDSKINMIRAGMTLAAPVPGEDGIVAGGRMYLANRCFQVMLRDTQGRRVQFVLVPFPFSSRYDLSAMEYHSKEEEHRLLHARVSQRLREMGQKLDPTLPTVLCAHLNVRGAEVHRLYKLTDREDILFELADLHPGWAYIALGHIHLPQTLGNSPHIQYAGSLDRLDFGEDHNYHGVTLLEVAGGQSVEPIRIPLPCTPFHTISLQQPDLELASLAERYPDGNQAIVRFQLAPSSNGMSRDEIGRHLKKLFPRWHELKWLDAEISKQSASVDLESRVSFGDTVKTYLEAQLKDHPQKALLLELAQGFVDQVRSA